MTLFVILLHCYLQYVNTQKHLQRFLLAKYNLHDIPLSQLDLQFVENFDLYLRVERKLKPASVNCVIIQLISAAKTALHRNLISHPPFFGYKLERPSFQIRSLTANELNKLVFVVNLLPILYERQRVFATITLQSSLTDVKHQA
jgi:hypothetical protein